jgi:predicted dienelactone hydrolase
MRPIETLLALTNLLTFIVLAIPRLRAVSWMRHSAPIALLIAVAQVVVEGARWQMIPAYVFTGLFFLVLLLKTIALAGQPAELKLTHRVAFGLVIGLSVLGLAVSIALPIVLPVFLFPRPSGPFAIGTVTYHWTDASRQEVFSTDKNTRRELMAQVWYPAKLGSSFSHTPYIRDSDAVATAVARLHNFPDFSLKHLKYVTTNAAESVPIADDKPSYPVLIYLEGLTGYRQMNTFQVEELVSHGYIVVGIDQPGVAASVVFPDGHQIAGLSKTQMDPLIQQSASPAEKAPLLNGLAFKDGIIPYLAQDVSFALDQLATLNSTDPNNILNGKLDMKRTALFGVSIGGIVGAETCLNDPRFTACLLMDVFMTADVVQKGLRQPSMWITRDAETMRLERQNAGGWTEKDIEQTQTTMRAVYNNLPGDGYFVQLPGMFHIDFTDLTYLSPIFPKTGFSGPIGAQRAHDIVSAYSVAFFDKHLKGIATKLLDGPAKQYPEVLFETRRR